MQVEIKELKRLIKTTEEKIIKLEEKERTRDVVSGGAGGTQHFKVEGFPVPEYAKVKRLLISRRERLKMKEEELLEITNQAEKYIESIKKSEIRIMFRMRYVEGLTWNQVAHQMNEMFSRTKRTGARECSSHVGRVRLTRDGKLAVREWRSIRNR